MPDIPSQIPPFALPEVFPEVIPQQEFQLGDSVRWRSVPNGDFGRILGVIYTDSASCIVTGLHYLVLLDENSPSRSITRYDFAFEEDIERLDCSCLSQTKRQS
jgi:hypothetical protein